MSITRERLAGMLVDAGLISRESIEDAEDYDAFVTLERVSRVAEELERENRENAELKAAKEIIAETLKALPVGSIPEHTPESIPGRVAFFVGEYARNERLRECAAELASALEHYTRVGGAVGREAVKSWKKLNLEILRDDLPDGAAGTDGEMRDAFESYLSSIHCMCMDPAITKKDILDYLFGGEYPTKKTP